MTVEERIDLVRRGAAARRQERARKRMRLQDLFIWGNTSIILHKSMCLASQTVLYAKPEAPPMTQKGKRLVSPHADHMKC